MNLYGTGFDVDYDAALLWLKKAQQSGDPRVAADAAKGVAELSQLIDRADDFVKTARKDVPAPERLPYIRAPRSAEEAETAKRVARAVGDAQVRT
jgi:hypothetical protein